MSLCLTNYKAMKMHSLLDEAPRHGDVLGEWWYSPRILKLSTCWRCVVSFRPRPNYLHGRTLRFPLDRRLGGPQSRSGRGGEEQKRILAPAGNRIPTI